MKRIAFPIMAVFCMLWSTGYARVEKNSMSAYVMSFSENKGQIIDQNNNPRNDIKFSLQQKDVNIFVGTTALHYQWSQLQPGDTKGITVPLTDVYRMDVELLGANKNAKVIVEEKQTSYKRYYLHQCPNGVVASNYNKITYKNIYPSIDWVLYISGSGALKYDFIVHDGGDPADIKLQYNGATSLKLVNGALEAATPMGAIKELAPYTYVEDGPQVKSSYKLNGSTLSFDIAAYDAQHKDLVIDPTIGWCTYAGGAGTEYGYSVATDSSGNAYLVGNTTSGTSWVSTSGGYRNTYAGSKDAFMALYSSTGAIQWFTYYGDTGADNFFYAATDTLDNVYVVGVTTSTANIATTTPSTIHQSTFGGGSADAFLVKFNKTGARVWATYFGGLLDEANPLSLEDYMVGVAWDHSNNKIYVCGNTLSTNAISTTGSYQISKASGVSTPDGYLAQFNDNGSRAWGTYFGGPGEDKIVKVSCDNSGSVYIVGRTNSPSGIASSSSVHQSTLGGPSSTSANLDAFVAKFNYLGVRQWSTYYGGTADDDPQGIGTDVLGNVYIAGTTSSTSEIASTGAFQTTVAGGNDSYLAKFNATGVRQWGTYFGGSGSETTADIAIDNTGNVCFAGLTNSNTTAPNISIGPTTNAYQTTYGGSSGDAFCAIFSPSGTRTYVSYIGGSGTDFAFGINYSRIGDLFVAGSTNSTGLAGAGGLATPSATQSNMAGVQDAFLAKFKADTSSFIQLPFGPLVYCPGDSIRVPFGVTNPFFSNNNFVLEISDALGSFGSPTVLSTLTSTNQPGTLRAIIPYTMSPGTGYRIRITSTNPAGVSFDNGENITVKPRPAPPTFVTNSPICAGKDLTLKATTASSGTATYSWTGPLGFTDNKQTTAVVAAPATASGYYVATVTINGCKNKDSVLTSVTIGPTKPVLTINNPACSGDTLKLRASSTGPGTITYVWTGPSFASSHQDTFRANIDVVHSGYYKVVSTLGICTNQDSTLVTIYKTVTPSVLLTVLPGNVICIKDSVKFTATGMNGGFGAAYSWYLNGQKIPGAVGFRYDLDTPKNGDVVKVIFTSTENCITKPGDTQTVTMTVVPPTPPVITVVSTATQGPVGYQIMFAGIPTFGGPTPTYKWFKNGTLIPGANNDTLFLTIGKDLQEGDCITCELTSSLSCTNPKTALSNSICIGKLLPTTSVGSINLTNDLQLYPNPNNGNFTIKGKIPGEADLDIQMTNSIGQVVHHQHVVQKGILVDLPIKVTGVASGVYTLRVKAGEDVAIWRMVIDEK